MKTIGGEYISPDLKFGLYENMKESHKELYNKVDNGYIPSLQELDYSEITSEINSAFLISKKSQNRINI